LNDYVFIKEALPVFKTAIFPAKGTGHKSEGLPMPRENYAIITILTGDKINPRLLIFLRCPTLDGVFEK